MGAFPKHSGDTSIDLSPNPSRFNIVEAYSSGSNVAIKITYPNCKNYEGKKILVFRDTTIKRIRNQSKIDPHFSETELSPFARFEPTVIGWSYAKELCRLLER